MAKETVQIRLERFEIEWLNNEAQRLGCSRGAVIRSLIRAQPGIVPQPVSKASCKFR